MFKPFKSVSVAIMLLMLPAITFAQVTYDINFTSNAPTIDGIVSPGEWADAAAAEGGWRILRDPTGRPDAHNNTFQMAWDDTHLYLLTESDWGGWTTNQRDIFRGGANNVNIYFDPNLDGEPSQGDPLTGPFSEPDGYQIAVNQYLGTFGCTACSTETDGNPANAINSGEIGSNLSTFAEAHVDGLFGNAGEWQGMRGTRIGTVNSAAGGVVEIAIPWTDFDAPQVDVNGLATGLDIGGAAPVNGDTWFFNIGQISTDESNNLPVWSWHDNPGGQEFFAAHPHGDVTFGGRPTTVSGDFDGNGDYACEDVDPLVGEIVAGTNDPAFDLTGDGIVDNADLTEWLAEAGAAELPSGASYLLGDANLDGSVDVSDFNVWNGSVFTNTAAWCSGDFNADGAVDVGDFNIWNENNFTTADGVSTVPEPGTFSLVGLAMLFLAGISRRK